MRIFRKTLLLFVVLIIIFIYYFYEIKSTPRKEKKKQESKKIFLIEKEKIKSIIINNEDKKIELVNLNGLWVIKDKNYECDKNEIETLFNKLLSLEIDRNLGEVENLSQYGLDNTNKFIEITYNGTKLILYIGDQTPSGSYFYVSKDRKNVFLVYKWDLNSIIEKNIFDFRDKRIIPSDLAKTDIEEIEIKKDKISYILKKEIDKWFIEFPLKDLSDKEKIENILEKIINGKVKSFEEEKKEKECGLDKPKITILLKTKNNQYFLYFGKKFDDAYYCKNSLKGYIFLVGKDILENIPDEISQLREKKLFDFNVSDVIGFSIIKNGKELKIIKENEKYYIEKDKNKKISKEKIDDFLYDLKYLEIKDFIDYSEINLKKYQLTSPLIKIYVSDNKSKTEIHFGKKTDKDIYCYHPERKIIFTIPSSDYSKIDKNEEFFIEKEKVNE